MTSRNRLLLPHGLPARKFGLADPVLPLRAGLLERGGECFDARYGFLRKQS